MSGSRVSVEEEDGHYKLDWEVFRGKMKQLRAWTEEHAWQEWKTLEASPDVARDFNGPKKCLKGLRLHILACLLGEERVWHRQGKYEDKS
eukprot:8069508-Lingulodinium_polyedra.AAC.1